MTPLGNIDALPPEQPRVDGPSAGSEQREGHAEREEQDVNPGIPVKKEEVVNLQHREERSGYRRPQPYQQQDSKNNLKDNDRSWPQRERTGECDEPAVDQRGAANQPHDE